MDKNEIVADMNLGRVTGRDVTEIVFRAYRDQDIFLGEMLIGECQDSGRRFILRVINIMHGNEASESVRKAQRKFIMMWLYLSKNGGSLTEQDWLRYMSYLTWKDKGLIFLTRFYAPRRMMKLTFEVREYVRRRLSGHKMVLKKMRHTRWSRTGSVHG